MFIDIFSFSLSENPIPPNSLAPFINSYLQVVTDSVLVHHGVLDTYTGDAVSSWWRNPMEACQCAKQIVEQVDLLNVRNLSAHLPKIKVGIGMNTGIVTLGNYGSSQRIRFTVLGDNVNLSSRLCGLANTQYQVPIIITGATQLLIGDTIATMALATVRVKGNDEPIELFTL